MKLSRSPLFTLAYAWSWLVVRVLRLNIPWCMNVYKSYHVLVHGTRSAERGKRDAMSRVLEQMADEFAADKKKREQSR